LPLRARDEATSRPRQGEIVGRFGSRALEAISASSNSLRPKGLLAEACARLSGLSKLTRDEMRLASYPDSMPEIDVCE
jgi:hypothetical protein